MDELTYAAPGVRTRPRQTGRGACIQKLQSEQKSRSSIQHGTSSRPYYVRISCLLYTPLRDAVKQATGLGSQAIAGAVLTLVFCPCSLKRRAPAVDYANEM